MFLYYWVFLLNYFMSDHLLVTVFEIFLNEKNWANMVLSPSERMFLLFLPGQRRTFYLPETLSSLNFLNTILIWCLSLLSHYVLFLHIFCWSLLIFLTSACWIGPRLSLWIYSVFFLRLFPRCSHSVSCFKFLKWNNGNIMHNLLPHFIPSLS